MRSATFMSRPKKNPGGYPGFFTTLKWLEVKSQCGANLSSTRQGDTKASRNDGARTNIGAGPGKEAAQFAAGLKQVRSQHRAVRAGSQRPACRCNAGCPWPYRRRSGSCPIRSLPNDPCGSLPVHRPLCGCRSGPGCAPEQTWSPRSECHHRCTTHRTHGNAEHGAQ